MVGAKDLPKLNPFLRDSSIVQNDKELLNYK